MPGRSGRRVKALSCGFPRQLKEAFKARVERVAKTAFAGTQGLDGAS